MNNAARNILGSSFIIWIVCAIAGFFYLFTFEGLVPRLRPDRIKFGIDLIGGTYITLEVQTDKAIEAELHDKIQSLLSKFGEESLESQSIHGNKAIVRFANSQDAHNFADMASKEDGNIIVGAQNDEVSISLNDKSVHAIREWAVQGNIKVLRTRLDSLGVGEISIAAQGEKNIIVELPNVDDPQKAKAMIGKPALLEIKLIEKIGSSEEEILDEYDGQLPDDMVIVPGKDEGYGKKYFLVPAFTDLTGRLLKDAYTGFGGPMQTEVVVHFSLTPEGGQKFYELTRKNPHRRLAMIVDGVVISSPQVSGPIGADAYIHGNFTSESANELAMLLKSGAFVAPVTFVEERQIGPSLGAESIHQGLMACLVGLVLLFIFSVFMYKVAGFFAILALLYNLLIILIVLGFIHATLTLPGIAGMVLTIGMAIDASILIYEKIREEIAANVAFKKAVQVGFSDAMEVILDSNITTFIVGIVLYKFGAGPIQGFALTLMIGIGATLVTGLFFLRSIFTFVLHNLGMQSVKI